jgi:hypothetical protein
VADWDGWAEMIAPDPGIFVRARTDDEYKNKIKEEEEYLFDSSPGGMEVAMGTVEVHLKDGEIVTDDRR